jgi:hypothetical protein
MRHLLILLAASTSLAACSHRRDHQRRSRRSDRDRRSGRGGPGRSGARAKGAARQLRLRHRRHGPQRRAGRQFLQFRQRHLGERPRRSRPTAPISACSRCWRSFPTNAPARSSTRRRASPAPRSAISTPASWTKAVNAAGFAPIAPVLNRIDAIRSKADLAAMMGDLSRMGVNAPFGNYVDSDDKDPNTAIFQLSQGGLGLPDRDYYLSKDPALVAKRDAYRTYLVQLMKLAGAPNAESRAAPFVEANFAFRGTALGGTPQLQERWKRGVDLVTGAHGRGRRPALCRALLPARGQGGGRRARPNVIAAMDRRLQGLTWMAPETKARRAPSSPPSRPRSAIRTSGAIIRRSRSAGDAVGNAMRASEFEPQRNSASSASRSTARVGHVPADGERLCQPAGTRSSSRPRSCSRPSSIPMPIRRSITAASARSSATRSATISTTRARKYDAKGNAARMVDGGRRRRSSADRSSSSRSMTPTSRCPARRSTASSRSARTSPTSPASPSPTTPTRCSGSARPA